MTTEDRAAGEFWGGDVLDRKSDARYLTKYLTRRWESKPKEQGFVLAVNAEWGFGKTFLLHRWCEELKHLGHPSVYFDAWDNDFTPEPLIAFMAEMEVGLHPHFAKIPALKKLLTKVVKTGRAFVKPVVGAATRVAVAAGTGVVVGAVGAALEGEDFQVASKELVSEKDFRKALDRAYDQALKQHVTTKQAIKAFRESVAGLVDTLSRSEVPLPIFFFIDELDRCRPDYAIELLEGVKHLFGVRGIYFVVATNLIQLGESTKAIYGPGFDGARYLKRFFDLEYTLPEPSMLQFATALWKDVHLPDGRIATGIHEYRQIIAADYVPELFAVYAEFYGRGLRDQEQIMRILEAALVSLDKGKIHIHFLIALACIYQASPQVFEAVVRSRSIGEVTGYRKLMKDTKGIIHLSPVPGYPDQQQTSTTVNAVLTVYLQDAWRDLREIKRDGNAVKFPQNINHIIAQELPSSYVSRTSYPPSIMNYPDIIRHAGGFANSTWRSELKT